MFRQAFISFISLRAVFKKKKKDVRKMQTENNWEKGTELQKFSHLNYCDYSSLGRCVKGNQLSLQIQAL